MISAAGKAPCCMRGARTKLHRSTILARMQMPQFLKDILLVVLLALPSHTRNGWGVGGRDYIWFVWAALLGSAASPYSKHCLGYYKCLIRSQSSEIIDSDHSAGYWLF